MSDSGAGNPLAHWPRPLTFVLSGGGSYGAVQVGMIRALVEAGVKPDLVVGSSIGALNGAVLAADSDNSADRLMTVWEQIDRRTLYGADSRLRAAWEVAREGLTGQGAALCSPKPLARLIEAAVDVDRIEELPTPMVVVATDLLVGQPKLLRQGPLAPALLASSAAPVVFPPVQIEGVIYVDGSVSANVPVRQALAAGARSMIVLDAGPAHMPGFIPRTPWEALHQASRIMMNSQHAVADEDLSNRHPIMRLPRPTPPALSSFDFSQTRELVEMGFNSTKQFLGDYEELSDAGRRL
ncbi:MAG: patatin-like phospholipase family protein [Acidimicrobiia bacterium]|nr:patatin-like phospholipase family protein [Acidimicrobiia bacterium]